MRARSRRALFAGRQAHPVVVSDKTLRLWDAATGAAIGEPLRHEGPVKGAVYSPDGKRILSWSDDKTLRLWDAATGAAIGEPLRHEGPV